MFQRSISYTALLAGLFGASAAVADLTADRVWAQTIDLIEEAGGSITALAHSVVRFWGRSLDVPHVFSSVF